MLCFLHWARMATQKKPAELSSIFSDFLVQVPYLLVDKKQFADCHQTGGHNLSTIWVRNTLENGKTGFRDLSGSSLNRLNWIGGVVSGGMGRMELTPEIFRGQIYRTWGIIGKGVEGKLDNGWVIQNFWRRQLVFISMGIHENNLVARWWVQF